MLVKKIIVTVFGLAMVANMAMALNLNNYPLATENRTTEAVTCTVAGTAYPKTWEADAVIDYTIIANGGDITWLNSGKVAGTPIFQEQARWNQNPVLVKADEIWWFSSLTAGATAEIDIMPY